MDIGSDDRGCTRSGFPAAAAAGDLFRDLLDHRFIHHPVVEARKVRPPMRQEIVGFDLDEESHWRAKLACGHHQHVRHDPPLITRIWVATESGRESMLGRTLECRKCDEDLPAVLS